MSLPRIMIASAGSGSGKTQITCGILGSLLNWGLQPVAFKCGPDYIDPMFHTRVLGIPSRNLDTYFTDPDTTKYLFCRNAIKHDISVIEGVMGYYDGLSFQSDRASSHELARVLEVPVILVINCSGMGMSVMPIIQGFLHYQKNSMIAGVILNQASKQVYEGLKDSIEKLSVKALGYVPYLPDFVMESRHLGLVMPDEMDGFQEKWKVLAEKMEETLDIEGIIRIARQASDLSYTFPDIPKTDQTVAIAVAKDEAFCFYYEDNLELLRQMGADIQFFSPLTDTELPENVQGILIGGGYPELYARELSSNKKMRESIFEALRKGIPCMAECGGFMYLHEELEDMSGNSFPGVGWIKGRVYYTGKLKRFGYIMLTAKRDQMILESGEQVKGHEYHHYESTSCGDSLLARKPESGKTWDCGHGNSFLQVGFPHLYYYSNIQVPYGFLSACGCFAENIRCGERDME